MTARIRTNADGPFPRSMQTTGTNS